MNLEETELGDVSVAVVSSRASTGTQDPTSSQTLIKDMEVSSGNRGAQPIWAGPSHLRKRQEC